MVIQGRTIDFLASPEFAATREFLARFGISPRPVDQFLEEDVIKAIRSKGWGPEFTEEVDPPGWRVEIREWRNVSQSRSTVAHDRDRMAGLLRALRLALSWPTEEEERTAFDAQTQALLGLSPDEFIRRWRKNALPREHPHVMHLLVIRPLGFDDFRI